MIYLNQASRKFQKAFHPSSNSPTKYPNPLPDIHPIILVHKNQRQHVYTAEVAGEREHLKTGIDTSRERKRERERERETEREKWGEGESVQAGSIST